MMVWKGRSSPPGDFMNSDRFYICLSGVPIASENLCRRTPFRDQLAHVFIHNILKLSNLVRNPTSTGPFPVDPRFSSFTRKLRDIDILAFRILTW